MKRICTHCFLILFGVLGMLASTAAVAQTIEPVIVEFKQKGEGKFVLTNDTLSPMSVVLEPRSFNIAPDGEAMFRALDPGIHLELSTMSLRLDPKQSYYIFYKVHADSLPSWFTIYAVFSPIHRAPGVNLRIMLPHTVYLYQKTAFRRDAVIIKRALYIPERKIVVCDIENGGSDLGRVREARVAQGKESVGISGFPLLPGSSRHIEVPWTNKKPPQYLILRFDRFNVRAPLTSQISEAQAP